MAALLVLTTVAAYWPAIHHEFLLYDDAGYVTDNPRVHDGLTLEGVRWALATGAMANWHPLTWLSYLLDASLFGLDPGRMHAVNVALHALGAVLLFLALAAYVGYWHDGVTLFTRALAVTRDNYIAHYQLASELARRGRGKRRSRTTGRRSASRRSTSKPTSPSRALLTAGRLDEAAEHAAAASPPTPPSATTTSRSPSPPREQLVDDRRLGTRQSHLRVEHRGRAGGRQPRPTRRRPRGTSPEGRAWFTSSLVRSSCSRKRDSAIVGGVKRASQPPRRSVTNAVSPAGVDRSLIQWTLRLSPRERLAVLEEHLRAVRALRRDAATR